jgi:predicted RNase H-like HicB family nuclease
MAQFVALILKDADSDYGISFRDFTGLISAGPDLEEARNRGSASFSYRGFSGRW